MAEQLDGDSAKVGLSAQEWVTMWDGGSWTHDHNDDDHKAGCGECSHKEGDHHHSHGSSGIEEGRGCDHGHYLRKNITHLTDGNTDKTVFVSLCGDSLDMEWLCSQGYSVVGAEISETAVKTVFEKGTEGPIQFKVVTDGDLKIYSATDDKRLKIYIGNFLTDTVNPNKLGTFDCILDAHGIVSIPVSQQRAYAQKLLTFLKPGGKMMFSTVDFDVTKLKRGPAPAPVPASLLQEFYPQGEVKLLANDPLPAGELDGIEEWTNPIVLISFPLAV